jgi:putative addiction module killer protein
MKSVLEYVDGSGRHPFGEWFDSLDPQAAAKVRIALLRLGEGNLARVKSVRGGVHEIRVDFGPGYRIYFGQDGEVLVILLAGGTKQRQDEDIAAARTLGRLQETQEANAVTCH